jgi:hypothetical protein
MIIDNEEGANIQAIRNKFGQIPNVWVKVFDYRKDQTAAGTGMKALKRRGRPGRKT